MTCRGCECMLPHTSRWASPGTARRPAYTVWPSGEPLIVTITGDHLDMWRRQYDEGARPELPEELVDDIDRILGVSRPPSAPESETRVDG